MAYYLVFERCVEYDGYKTYQSIYKNSSWFEMCVEYDGYKTIVQMFIVAVRFEKCVEYDEYKTNNTNYQYTIRLRCV